MICQRIRSIVATVHSIGVSFAKSNNFVRVDWSVWLPVDIIRSLTGCYGVTKISSTVSSLWCILLMACVNKWFAYGLEYSLNDLSED